MMRHIRRRVRRWLPTCGVCVVIYYVASYCVSSFSVDSALPRDDAIQRAKILKGSLPPSVKPIIKLKRENTSTSTVRKSDPLFVSSEIYYGDNPTYKMFQSHEEIRISYSEFNFTLPQFVDESDKEHFLTNDQSKQLMHPKRENDMLGVVRLIKNAIYVQNMECGVKSKLDVFQSSSWGAQNALLRVDRGCLLVAEGGDTFSGFVQNVIPKLVQVYHLLKEQTNISLVILRPKHNMIYELLDYLGFGRERLVYYISAYVTFKQQINTCITPLHHPYIWQKTRNLLGILPVIQGNDQMENVVFIVNSGQEGGEYSLGNQKEIETFLRWKYGTSYVVLSDSISVEVTKQLFSRAKILIGLKSGMMVNLLFAPKGVNVIEFLPPSDTDMTSGAREVTWRLASSLGAHYWSVYAKTSVKGVTIDLNKLKTILSRIEQEN